MVKWLRDRKSGQFAGSVGVGKMRVPSSSPDLSLGVPESGNRLGVSDLDKTFIALAFPDAMSSALDDRINAARVNPLDPRVAKLLAGGQDSSVLLNLAENSSLDYDLLMGLSYHPDDLVRGHAVSSGRLSEERLAELMLDANIDVRITVATYAGSEETLERLADDPSRDVVVAVVDNWRSPLTLLDKLSYHRSPKIKRRIASSYRAPEGVLKKLASDEAYSVRSAVGGNWRTPSEILDELSRDGEEKVRIQVAGNPSTGVDTLVRVAHDDESIFVRSAATDQLNNLPSRNDVPR